MPPAIITPSVYNKDSIIEEISNVSMDSDELNELEDLPEGILRSLHESVSNQRWVIPVQERGHLEVLLKKAIQLKKLGRPQDTDNLLQFYQVDLVTCFAKILNDEAVLTWNLDTLNLILSCVKHFIDLCLLKLISDDDDLGPLLEILYMIFNINSKFNQKNSVVTSYDDVGDDYDYKYALSSSDRYPRIWLVEVMNRFGAGGGFQAVHDRFIARNKEGVYISISDMNAYLKMFMYCYDLFSSYTMETYFLPILEHIPVVLDSIPDKQLKKMESQTVALDSVLRIARCISSRASFLITVPADLYSVTPLLPPPALISLSSGAIGGGGSGSVHNGQLTGGEAPCSSFTIHRDVIPEVTISPTPEPASNRASDLVHSLSMFKLKMILRILRISSFNGKMNALNELNKVLINAQSNFHRHGNSTYEDETLTSDKLADWIHECNVLEVVFKDCLHQPQYVDKLEKIIRFMLKKRTFRLTDLDCIWSAQIGKHEAIVKNLHDLLAKLAWDFNHDQLQHLFSCFQISWKTAINKQKEKLLELIHRLAEDDKGGTMTVKVLELLWELIEGEETDFNIIDQAMSIQVKILKYNTCEDRTSQKIYWIENYYNKLGDKKWVITAMNQIIQIISLFTPLSYSDNIQHHQQEYKYKEQVISHLCHQYNLIREMVQNLVQYMDETRQLIETEPGLKPEDILPDRRHNHRLQVTHRLYFIRFFLKDGRMWLSEAEAEKVWKSLIMQAIYPCDQENCFLWFNELMDNDPDLEPDTAKGFFIENVLRFDPSRMTSISIDCFERFFKSVNLHSKNLKLENRKFILQRQSLIGIEYIWKMILMSKDQVANKAIRLIKEIYTNLSPKMREERQAEIHDDIISMCMNKLMCFYDTVVSLSQPKSEADGAAPGGGSSMRADKVHIDSHVGSMIRMMTTLNEYFRECDNTFYFDRKHKPLYRASKGKQVKLSVHMNVLNKSRSEFFTIDSHLNEEIAMVIKMIQESPTNRLNKPNIQSTDYAINGYHIEKCDHHKILDNFVNQFNMNITCIITVSLTCDSSFSSGLRTRTSSGDSSNSDGSVNRNSDHSAICQQEESLPGVIFSRTKRYSRFLLKVIALSCRLSLPELRNSTRAIFKLIPADAGVDKRLRDLCRGYICTDKLHSKGDGTLSSKLKMELMGETLSECIYNLEIVYSMILPAADCDNASRDFLKNFIISGGCLVIFEILVDTDYIGCNGVANMREAYEILLKLSKLLLTCVGYAYIQMASIDSPPDIRGDTVSKTKAIRVQSCIQAIPVPYIHAEMKTQACIVGTALGTKACYYIPKMDVIKKVQYIVWSSAIGQLDNSVDSYHDLHSLFTKVTNGSTDEFVTKLEDRIICHESMQLLSILLMLCPLKKTDLISDCSWKLFIKDLLLGSNFSSIRSTTMEQLTLIAKSSMEDNIDLVKYLIEMLFDIIDTDVPRNQENSSQYFQFLCSLLTFIERKSSEIDVHKYIVNEQNWQKRAYAETKDGVPLEAVLLEGHLNIFRQLLSFCDTSYKVTIGSQHVGPLWIKTLIKDYLFPSSYEMQRNSSKRSKIHSPISDKKRVHSENLEEDTLDSSSFITTATTNTTTSSTGSIGDISFGTSITASDLSMDSATASPDTTISCTDSPSSSPTPPLSTSSAASSSTPASSSSSPYSYTTMVEPFCTSEPTMTATFELLNEFSRNSLENLTYLTELLERIFSINKSLNLHWGYIPPVGPRSSNGFVGLKNASATCYMNSVLQQLYMITPIRDYILNAEGSSEDFLDIVNEEFEIITDQGLNDALTIYDPSSLLTTTTSNQMTESTTSLSSQPNSVRQAYNEGVLRHIQSIFAHLQESRQQYHTPKQFWKHFRLLGVQINVREQHDALEFYNSLVDSLDEGLKSVNKRQIMERTLGGTFADQKICLGCPHRYSREEGFTSLNVEIRNQHNLQESLEQYVKGDLLEGANAYHCEKCDAKVDTVKRLCIKKLPPVLVIQLKRFGYDWERDTAIKYNDYFEFPRSIDMLPYTVHGLAMSKGEIIAEEDDDVELHNQGTNYRLCGVVVHSGQANGGHYFSYIRHNPKDGNGARWYKFDDIEISEVMMDEEELRSLCFGGDYSSDTYDTINKRKKWWNAYLLFYEKVDMTNDCENSIENIVQELSLDATHSRVHLPDAIQQLVTKENMKFSHENNQYTYEYFYFIQKLMDCSKHLMSGRLSKVHTSSQDLEEIYIVSTRFLINFLFSIGFMTKKSIFGDADIWAHILVNMLKSYRSCRMIFMQEVIFNPFTDILANYFLRSPYLEIRRSMYMILACMIDNSEHDGPCSSDVIKAYRMPALPTMHHLKNIHDISISRHIIISLLSLLCRDDLHDCSRNLSQYFYFILKHAESGYEKVKELIDYDVASIMILISRNDLSGIRPDLSYDDIIYIHKIVAKVVTCMHIGCHTQSAQEGKRAMNNPLYRAKDHHDITHSLAEKLLQDSNYMHRLLNNGEVAANTHLIPYLSWENCEFSHNILSILLNKINKTYTYEMKPFFEILMTVLLLKDSWEEDRIISVFKSGSIEKTKSLFEVIHSSMNHQEKRAYQCIKMISNLIDQSSIARKLLLNKDLEYLSKWKEYVQWFDEEIKESPAHISSNHVRSNETSNGYSIERTKSAISLLDQCVQQLPELSEESLSDGDPFQSGLQPTKSSYHFHY